ncbi:MAG: class I SAM-dependent methyltransferase [Phycisphaerales bacterium]|nr:MAG: class I SAM-dependent methyltransferase [Phycisphaerales bacterium]
MSAIIRRRSTNKTDVREAALDGLDLSSATKILDLGCGFGFMAEKLAGEVAPDAELLGVDAWQSNEKQFLEKVSSAGRSGRFHCVELDSTLPWENKSYDVVVCCFSLYFFVEILPEVARVLRPDGLFLAVTHSEHSVAGDLPAAGFEKAATGLLSLTRNFSAENGSELLGAHFGDVTRVNYINSLRFEKEHLDELFTYMRFKLPFLLPDAKPTDEIPDNLARYVGVAMARSGEVVVEKNDAIFRARRPLCH